MANSDPTLWSLTDAAEAIQQKNISAVELTQSCLQRIEASQAQEKLNCFISLDKEGALAQAQQADQASAKGESVGILHGVPLAHKDMYYRQGVISTCGAKIRREFRPDHTATVITRLANAGALNLGGLNMAEFAFGPTGHNAHYGACRNPWHTDHISGGSSSGSGVATAARLIFGALGSDTGGSVRLPAAACGLVGIKPTQTRVSRYGVMGLSFSLDNVGPLTRTVRDNARLLGVIAGYDQNDATSSQQPVADYEAATLNADIKGLKIGLPRNYYYDHINAEVQQLLQASLKIYADLGAEIVDVTVPDHEHLADLANIIQGAEAATLHDCWLRERPDDYGPQVRARIEYGLAYPATHYLRALHIRPKIIQRFVEQVFSQCDVLHTPVFDRPVPTIAETDLAANPGFAALLANLTWCTRPINYLSVPGLSMPAGFTANGLPVAFQLVGPPFAEALLYKTGAAYEAATDWTQRVPEF